MMEFFLFFFEGGGFQATWLQTTSSFCYILPDQQAISKQRRHRIDRQYYYCAEM